MSLSKLAFAALAAASTGLADFTFGSIAGEQLAGDFNHPSLDTINGHFIVGEGGDYSQANFCDAGIGISGNDADGNPLDPAWTNIDLDISDPPTYCDKPIPGLPTTVRISNAADVGGGDCGAAAVAGGVEAGGVVGALIDTVTSPNVAIGNCYYDFNCKYCANTGSQYASAVFTCLIGSQGGLYGSGIEGVNSDDSTSDC